jgi:hypothetical protein
VSNPSAPQPEARRPADVEAIRQLKARYLRYIDEQRWAELGDVFTDNAVVAGADHPQGRQGIVAHIRDLLSGGRSVHHAELEALEFTGERTASAKWAMSDRVELPAGSPHAGWSGSGGYHEDYVKDGDAWRIARLRLTRLRRDPLVDETR